MPSTLDNEMVLVGPHGVSVAQEADGLLRITLPPRIAFAGLLATIDFVRDLTRSHPHARLLLDLRRIDPAPGLVEQAIIGEHLAREMQHAGKLASVVAPGTRTGTTERVARGFNLDLRVFESEAEALRWIAPSCAAQGKGA